VGLTAVHRLTAVVGPVLAGRPELGQEGGGCLGNRVATPSTFVLE
jgi:hypothetical protein